MDSKFNLGGDLEKALSGDYSINIKAVFKEAWAITSKSNASLLIAIASVFSVFFLLLSVLMNLLGEQGYTLEDPQVHLFVQLASIIALAPFEAGLIMMGINQSVGALTRPKQVLSFLPKAAPIVLLALISSVLTNLGFIVYILPGIFILVASQFALPLMIEKQMAPLDALKISIKVSFYKWFHLLIIYALFVATLPIVFLTFGIALIWVAPMFYNVKGILYRNVFGVGVAVVSKSDMSSNDGSFSA